MTGSLLPEASFAEIAVDLFEFAQQAGFGLSAMEVYVAKAKPPSLALQRSLADCRRSAETAASLHHLFKALIPHEAEIRAALLDTIERKAA